MAEAIQEKRLAAAIAEWLVATKYEDLPQETVNAVKGFVLDVIGCTIGASSEPQIKALTEVISWQRRSAEFGLRSRVQDVGDERCASEWDHGAHLRFDDDHRGRLAVMLTSVAVFPAVFAVGEKQNVSGKELLRSHVLGLR